MTGNRQRRLDVWLINLDRAEARRDRMSKQLESMGIVFRRFPAIDGLSRAEEFKSRVDVAYYERRMGQVLLPGKVGCYFSHLEVWRKLAASESSVALIMEDDVVFHDDFVEALDRALEASEHWDLLRLNCTRGKMPITQGMVGRYRLNAYLGRFTGNGCYLVKKEVTERLLPKLEVMKLAFEYEVGRYFAHDYRQFGLEPFPSHVDNGVVSQITGKSDEKLRKLGGVKKIPHLLFKSSNYARRFTYLAKRNLIHNRFTQLLDVVDD